MNYGVGDEVVCIDSLPLPGDDEALGIGAGNKYRVAILNDMCVGLQGQFCDNHDIACGDCGRTDVFWHYWPWRFIKLDGLKEDQAIDEEITA